MSDAQQEAKFTALVARSGMPAGQGARLLAALRQLDRHETLSEIVALCTVH
jgi:hypothetical protein